MGVNSGDSRPRGAPRLLAPLAASFDPYQAPAAARHGPAQAPNQHPKCPPRATVHFRGVLTHRGQPGEDAAMHLTIYRLHLFLSRAPMPWTRPLSWVSIRRHRGLGTACTACTEVFIGPLHVAISVALPT